VRKEKSSADEHHGKKDDCARPAAPLQGLGEEQPYGETQQDGTGLARYGQLPEAARNACERVGGLPEAGEHEDDQDDLRSTRRAFSSQQ
jgi:hypothetical protein